MAAATPYPRIISQVFTSPWQILPEHHAAISAALLAHVDGKGQNIPDFSENNFASRPMNRDRFLNPVEISDDGSIAVMTIEGTLGKKLSMLETFCGGVDLQHIDKDIEELARDDRIQTVIFDIDSPGGMARPSSDTAQRILELSKAKRTIAYTDGTMASAGYKLASACGKIYASNSADVGCVGTYIALYDQSEALKKRGIELKLFRDGKYKALGYPGKAMTEEESNYLTSEVSGLSAKFKDFVRKQRPGIDESALEGQCLSGKRAQDAGLIDGVYQDLGSLVAAEIKRPLTF